jgi:hypothetical protein
MHGAKIRSVGELTQGRTEDCSSDDVAQLSMIRNCQAAA